MSIFKSTFKQYVKDQLKVRESARNAQGRLLPKNIQYLNSRTGWVRLTSTVDIDPDSELARKLGKGQEGNLLAKKYILQGGTLFEKNNKLELRRGIGSEGGAYGDKVLGGPNINWQQGGRQELGIRPMPGITSISVKSKSAYGSLREATININCWNMSQLEELELLYMRPGYGVLLEWGSTLYLNNRDQNLSKFNKNIDILNTKTNKISKTDIYKKIQQYNQESDGNYDAIFGMVKNFRWSARQDGGFDCIINVISLGEVIESLKLNYATTDIGLVEKNINKISKNKDEISRKYKENKLEGTLLFLKQRLIEDSKGKTKGTYSITIDEGDGPTITTEYLSILFNFSGTVLTSNQNITDPQIYIPLKFLVEVLNRTILLLDVNNKEPFVKLSVNDRDDKPLECFAFKNQVSLDPRVCLITPSSNDLKSSDGNLIVPNFLSGISKDFQYFIDNNEKNRGVIGNIFLNIDNLIQNINDISFDSEKGIVDLYSFLKTTINQVQKSIGNINNFNIHIDGDNDTVRIIDIQYLPNGFKETVIGQEISAKSVSILKTFGTETTVRNYSLESSVFPSMTTMIAISAQANGGVLGYDNATYVKFNEGLINRIIPKIDEKKSETPISQAPIIPQGIILPGIPFAGFINEVFKNYDPAKERARQDFYKNQSGLVEFFKALNENKNVLIDNIEDLQNALHDMMIYEQNNSPEKKEESKYKGIMPLKLSIEMDGIAGIVIGEIFTIPDDRLPLGYKSSGGFKVGFIVTGIQQSIQLNDWVTTLETQTCILKP